MTHAWSRQLFGSTQYNPPSRFFDEIPDELVESIGNVTGRSSYGRQSYRRRGDRDERGDDPAPEVPEYRRARRDDTGGIDINADLHEAEQERHKERVVDAAMRAGKKVEPSNSQELGLSVGDHVEHPAFGAGVIIAIDGEGDTTEAVINFSDGVGLKHLSLAWAPLKRL